MNSCVMLYVRLSCFVDVCARNLHVYALFVVYGVVLCGVVWFVCAFVCVCVGVRVCVFVVVMCVMLYGLLLYLVLMICVCVFVCAPSIRLMCVVCCVCGSLCDAVWVVSLRVFVFVWFVRSLSCDGCTACCLVCFGFVLVCAFFV